MNKKRKKDFLTALVSVINKDPTRKHANELKVHEKTVRTANKDLSQDPNPFDYVKWSILESTKNTISHPNIGSLKTAIEDK